MPLKTDFPKYPSGKIVAERRSRSPIHPQKVSENRVVALISCVKGKKSSAAAAKDLYVSPLFKKSRALAESQGWEWFILSSRYGLVDPISTIAPYEETLNNMPRHKRIAWAHKVVNEISKTIPTPVTLVLLAGNRYVADLIPQLKARGYVIVDLLKGLSMGRRLFALDRMNIGKKALQLESINPLHVSENQARLNSVKNETKTSKQRDKNQTHSKDENSNHLIVDPTRARDLAKSLYRAYLPDGEGIFGVHEMPEDIIPAGMKIGSREHILFLTFTISINYIRDADILWKAAGKAWAEKSTRYLFDPEKITGSPLAKVISDLRSTGISLRKDRDGQAWFTIAKVLASKWQSDPKNFLTSCDYQGSTILYHLEKDWHEDDHGNPEPDFPLLKGPKIASLWIRALRDNAGLKFNGLSDVPIPVDVHVLRSTLCTGVLYEIGRAHV